MKTAMQELMDYLNSDEFTGICDIRDMVEELFKKEERQIIDAFENGYDLSRSLVNFNGKKYFDEEFEYYNQTYNQTNVGNDGFEFDNSSTIPPPKTNN